MEKVLTETQTEVGLKELLRAGVHFGHQTHRWNPKMRKYIFAERGGIYLIDLKKTLQELERARRLVRDTVVGGQTVLFVCTKTQLAPIVRQEEHPPLEGSRAGRGGGFLRVLHEEGATPAEP
jgi:ribosomal protein S2